jgi:hypothetical protein
MTIISRKGRVYFLLLKNKKNHWIFGVCLLFGFVILSGVVRLNSQIVGAAGDYSVAYVIQNDWGTGATINFPAISTLRDCGTVFIPKTGLPSRSPIKCIMGR